MKGVNTPKAATAAVALDDKSTYKIVTWYADNAPCRRELLIALEYRDWCEFEKTQLYQNLIQYLSSLET